MQLWWTQELVESTVTADFVARKLPSKKQTLLNSPLVFGQGLTDGTYLEWILSKGQRLFLVLDDIGVPEHIFEAVDNSYDDEDLPFTEDTVVDLRLPSSALEKKFIRRQNTYLVQELEEGSHREYEDDEVVPVDSIPKGKGLTTPSRVDRVSVKNKTYTRRCIPLNGENGIEKVHFSLYFKNLPKLSHPHLVSIWATYIYRGNGFTMLHPSSEMTLKSFIDDPPKSFKQLPRSEQCQQLLQWVRCLSSAVALMHEHGFAHQAIRPSNIFIGRDNNIFLGSYAAVGALEDSEPAYEKDAYEVAAPEQWQKRATLQETNPLRSTLQSGGRTGRRIRDRNSSSASSSSTPSLSPTVSSGDAPSSESITNITVPSSGRNSRMRSHSLTSQSLAGSSSSGSNPSNPQNSARPSHAIISTLTYQKPYSARQISDQSSCFPADMFSLTAVIIKILSLAASTSQGSSKLSPSSLKSHLGKHNRQAGRGGGPADCSFHANLRQVATWLDSLEQLADRTSKKSNFFRTKSAQDDGEDWRWRVAIGNLAHLARHGISKDYRDRLPSAEHVRKVDEILQRGDIKLASCCSQCQSPMERPGSVAASVVTALHIAPSSVSSSGESSGIGSTSRARGSGSQAWRDHPSVMQAHETSLANTSTELSNMILEDEESVVMGLDSIIEPQLRSSVSSAGQWRGHSLSRNASKVTARNERILIEEDENEERQTLDHAYDGSSSSPTKPSYGASALLSRRSSKSKASSRGHHRSSQQSSSSKRNDLLADEIGGVPSSPKPDYSTEYSMHMPTNHSRPSTKSSAASPAAPEEWTYADHGANGRSSRGLQSGDAITRGQSEIVLGLRRPPTDSTALERMAASRTLLQEAR